MIVRMPQAIITIEYFAILKNTFCAVEVDVDEIGVVTACRLLSTGERVPVREFDAQLDEQERDFFRRLAARYHQELRRAAGIVEH